MVTALATRFNSFCLIPGNDSLLQRFILGQVLSILPNSKQAVDLYLSVREVFNNLIET